MNNELINIFGDKIEPRNYDKDKLHQLYTDLQNNESLLTPIFSVNNYNHNPYFNHTLVLLNKGYNLLSYKAINNNYMMNYLYEINGLYLYKISHFINLSINNNIHKYFDLNDIKDIQLLYINNIELSSLSNYILYPLNKLYTNERFNIYKNMEDDYFKDLILHIKIDISETLSNNIYNFSNSKNNVYRYDYCINQSTLLFENIFPDIMKTIQVILLEVKNIFSSLIEELLNLVFINSNNPQLNY